MRSHYYTVNEMHFMKEQVGFQALQFGLQTWGIKPESQQTTLDFTLYMNFLMTLMRLYYMMCESVE